MVNHFHDLYRDAVRGGRIPKAAATGRKPRDGARIAVEDLLPRDTARSMREVARSISDSPFANQVGTRATSPTASLGEIQEAGFSVSRGTVTTTDFIELGAEQIAFAMQEGGAGDGFSIELCFDADDTTWGHRRANTPRATSRRTATRRCATPTRPALQAARPLLARRTAQGALQAA